MGLTLDEHLRAEHTAMRIRAPDWTSKGAFIGDGNDEKAGKAFYIPELDSCIDADQA